MSSIVYLENPWTDEELRAVLPLPAADANKYSRGRLTVVAGTPRYPGAACLASGAGIRMGAGYTELVSCKDSATLALGRYPSLVVHDRLEWMKSALSSQKPNALRAICVGPGFSQDDAIAGQLTLYVLEQAICPVVVDGGALTDLATSQGLAALSERRRLGRTTVITPHMGEAARLRDALDLDLNLYQLEQPETAGNTKGCTTEQTQPALLAAALANATGATVALKGPDTYIARETNVRPMYEGTSALAKAGTGDVLAGMIAALLAQGLCPSDAATLGTTLHARAGIEAARLYTPISTSAEDVLDSIPAAIRTLMQ